VTCVSATHSSTSSPRTALSSSACLFVCIVSVPNAFGNTTISSFFLFSDVSLGFSAHDGVMREWQRRWKHYAAHRSLSSFVSFSSLLCCVLQRRGRESERGNKNCAVLSGECYSNGHHAVRLRVILNLFFFLPYVAAFTSFCFPFECEPKHICGYIWRE
jgi:hypothetical protein